METVQKTVQATINTAKQTLNMASTDTSFAAHVQNHFTSYEQDRQASSKDTTYATSNGVPIPHPYESQRAGECSACEGVWRPWIL